LTRLVRVAGTALKVSEFSLRVVATSRRVVSEDGRVMTISTIWKDLSAKSVKTIGVYEKQIKSGHRQASRLSRFEEDAD
jgi:hypothetical protein